MENIQMYDDYGIEGKKDGGVQPPLTGEEIIGERARSSIRVAEITLKATNATAQEVISGIPDASSGDGLYIRTIHTTPSYRANLPA